MKLLNGYLLVLILIWDQTFQLFLCILFLRFSLVRQILLVNLIIMNRNLCFLFWKSFWSFKGNHWNNNYNYKNWVNIKLAFLKKKFTPPTCYHHVSKSYIYYSFLAQLFYLHVTTFWQDLETADQIQVLITGSLHLVGGALACIQVKPLES